MRTIANPSTGFTLRTPRRLFLLCLLILGLPALAIAAIAIFPAPARLQYERWQGERFIAAREYGAALRHFRAAAEAAPHDPAPYLRIAAVYWGKGQVEQAEYAWRSAVDRDPGNAEALVGLGRVAAGRDRYGEAARYFQSALSRQPAALEARMALGDALVAEGDLGGGRREWAGVLASPGLTPEQEQMAHFQLALALLDEEPDVAVGHVARAEATGAGAIGRELLADVRQAAALDAGADGLHPAEGRDDRAYRAALLGYTYLRAGKPGPARTALERAVALRPDYGDALAYLGYACWRQGATADALAVLRRAAEAAPSAALPRYFTGVVLRGERRLEEASTALEEAAQRDPQNAALLRELARTRVAAADYASAAEAYEHATRLEPDNADLLHDAASFYLDHLFRINRGLALAEEAARLAAESATIQDALGWARHLNGDRPGAMLALRGALAIDPTFARAQYHLAVVLEQSGDRAAAVAAYRRVLDLDTGALAGQAREAIERP